MATLSSHRFIRTVFLLFLASGTLYAQELADLQIHGYVTQGFLYSSKNNYLSMNSSSGSLQWTDGAISLADSVTPKLRVGIQLHMYQLGQFGGPSIVVDWALADYKFDDRLGFRAGKVKTIIGLFNDSQDVDSVHQWVLLPQAMYPIDNRGFNLAALGGQVYGTLRLGERYGNLQYSADVGEAYLDPNGGYEEQLSEAGLTFPEAPGGTTYGGDLRWNTPVPGFLVGSSALSQSLDGTANDGTLHMPASSTTAQYAQWQHGRLYVAGEYWRMPFQLFGTVGGVAAYEAFDNRAWYPMVTYRLTEKLKVGTYYSHYMNKVGDTSNPASYSKDWVVSGRYDFNSYLYGKVESHFLHGTGLGYYSMVNPNGLAPDSKMLAAKVGFTF